MILHSQDSKGFETWSDHDSYQLCCSRTVLQAPRLRSKQWIYPQQLGKCFESNTKPEGSRQQHLPPGSAARIMGQLLLKFETLDRATFEFHILKFQGLDLCCSP